LVKKIKNIEDTDVELVVSESCPLLENLLAFKLLIDAAESLGKKLSLQFEDKNFAYLSEALNQLATPTQESVAASAVPVLSVSSSGVASSNILPEKGSLKLTIKLPSFKFNFRPKISLAIPFLVSVSFLVLVLILALYVYFVPKSAVSLTVDSEPLIRAIDVTASATASAGVADGVVIPALEISATSKRSESTASSGKKDVGEKAAGNITIYNKTAGSVSFPAGTLITYARVSGNDLKFLFNGNVTVSARTPNPLMVSGYDPGTGTAEVTAESFGDEYNLASGNTFLVGTRSTNDFVAQNSSNFTGGTKRQVVIVTAADQKNLLDNLVSSIKGELKADLLAKLVSGQVVDENSVVYKTTSKSFDHGVSEEAQQLSLTLEMSASVVAFSQDELRNVVYGKLLTYIPDGYKLFGKGYDVEIIEAKAYGRVLKISARGKGFIVPNVDTEDVKRKLVGKGTRYAENYLGGLSNISSHRIESPIKVGPFSFLPFRPDNLKVEVVRR
jgi:hypothetical protein